MLTSRCQLPHLPFCTSATGLYKVVVTARNTNGDSSNTAFPSTGLVVGELHTAPLPACRLRLAVEGDQVTLPEVRTLGATSKVLQCAAFC